MENLKITEILKDFYAVSGIRISIHDTEFNEIYSYPKEALPYCKCIQQNRQVFEDCLQNDKAAFKRVKSSGEVFVYKCRRGLYEAVAPIYHYGRLSGYLMMGQISDTDSQSEKLILNRTEKIVNDRKIAREITATVNCIDRKLLYSYINIMTVLAEYLTETNRIFSSNENLPHQVSDYINKNYSKKITLSILSQKFGCCNATLTKSFKKEYNISIMAYLCNVRLKNAEKLIKNSEKSFKEISYLCGFYDQNYFSKVFTKQYGKSPTDYRKAKSADIK